MFDYITQIIISPTCDGRSAGFMWPPPRPEGVLPGDEVVRGERPSSRGGGRAAQLCGGEADLAGAGARPREAVRKLLAGSVHRVPGTCRRVTDSRDVMITGKVIRRRQVLSVQWQGLSRVSGRLWVVHTGVLVRQVGWLSGRPRWIRLPGSC